MTDYVIVGGGLAGAKAAQGLREAGAEGSVRLIGAETEAPYDRPPLSKKYLAGEAPRHKLDLRKPEWYAANEVELLLGRAAVAIDRDLQQVQLDDGSRVPYDRLLLATGSEPRALRLPDGSQIPGALYLRRLEDSQALQRALGAGGPLVIVGGGWIGLEVASIARQRGVPVTLLELGPAPLSAVLGEQLGTRIAAEHRAHGVDLRTGVGVASATALDAASAAQSEAAGPQRTLLELTDGTRVEAAAVLVAIGARPLTELAEAAGLAAAGAGGVRVDGALRTSDPRIWAAGDIALAQNTWAGRPLRVEHWAVANDQGVFAGQSMAAGDGFEPRWAKPPYFWSDQYDLGLEYRGWADPRSAQLVVRGRPGWDEPGSGVPWLAFWLEGGRVVAGLHVNAWDDADQLKALVAAKAQVDPAALADPDADWSSVPRSAG